jgi:hypothetical protein
MDIIYDLLDGKFGAIYFALVMIPIFLVVPVYLAFAKFPHWQIDEKGIKVGKKEVLFTDVEFICFRVIQHQRGITKIIIVYLSDGKEVKLDPINTEVPIDKMGEIIYAYYKRYLLQVKP